MRGSSNTTASIAQQSSVVRLCQERRTDSTCQPKRERHQPSGPDQPISDRRASRPTPVWVLHWHLVCSCRAVAAATDGGRARTLLLVQRSPALAASAAAAAQVPAVASIVTQPATTYPHEARAVQHLRYLYTSVGSQLPSLPHRASLARRLPVVAPSLSPSLSHIYVLICSSRLSPTTATLQ